MKLGPDSITVLHILSIKKVDFSNIPPHSAIHRAQVPRGTPHWYQQKRSHAH